MNPPVNAADRPEPAPNPAVQEFPAGVPLALSAETISLSSLVHHRWEVDRETPLEELQKIFREKQVDFLALSEGDRVTGICSRVRLGSLLGSRFGFALYSRSPADLVQVPHPLVFPLSTPIREVLEKSLARHADEFHEDVAITDGEGQLVGMVSVESLAYLQNRLVKEQLGELERQHGLLQQQHMELFQADHALRQAQGLCRGLFESNTLGLALFESDGRIGAHNGRLAEMLNAAEGSPAIASLDPWMDEPDRPRFAGLLAARERDAPGANPTIREFLLKVPGRGPRLFRITTGWIRETGQVCACFDDITEQRGLERNLMRQEKQRLLDTLVGGIAHELNNKLTPVLGFAQILEQEAAGEMRQHAVLIGQSTQEACRIIRQLLQLSKPDSGRPQRIDLAAVAEEALLMLKFQVRERQCEVVVSRPDQPVAVQADPAQIKQVVINLALNALQAMEQAPAPRLAIAVGRGPAGAFLTVADNGSGIPPENLQRIFDPFFTTKGPDRGSGLGLSICFSIARQYGGDISVESQVGAGATFTLVLPPADGAPEAEERPPAGRVKKGRGPSARAARALVADDEAVVRLLLQEILRAHFGCQVDLAPNGAEALALAEGTEYDLVISDIRMPVMAGTEFYLRLRERRPGLARRFTFITGHPGDKSLQEEIGRWNVPVLAKPFTVARLLGVCQPLLAPEEAKAEKEAAIP